MRDLLTAFGIVAALVCVRYVWTSHGQAHPDSGPTASKDEAAPTDLRPSASTHGLTDPANFPPLTALGPDFKHCWEAHPEDATEDACPTLEKARRLFDTNDAAQSKAMFATLVNWFDEPSDWRYRKVAANLMAPFTMSEVGTPAALDRMLKALRSEPDPDPKFKATDNMRSEMAEVTGQLAEDVSGSDEAVLAFAKDKAFPDQFARGVFLAHLEKSSRPGVFELLTAIVKDHSEQDDARKGAIDALSEFEQPEVGVVLLDSARTDEDLVVARHALFSFKGYGAPGEAQAVIDIISARADAEMSLNGVIALGDGLGPKASVADKKIIAAFARKVAKDGHEAEHTRAVAVGALKDIKDPQWKSLAHQLTHSGDRELAEEVNDLLTGKTD